MKRSTFLLLILIVLVISGSHAISQAITKSNTREAILPEGQFQVNPELIYGSAPFSQSSPSIAFNGTVYLAVWTDNRNLLDNDIYGARIDTNGILLDPAGFIISNAPSNQRNPSVASNDNIFMVTWEDDRNLAQTGTDIYAARVNEDGTVTDVSGIALSRATDNQYAPKIASADENFFAVWSDDRLGTNTDIYGTFVTSNGNVSHADGLAICTQGSWQGNPFVCADLTRYFLVWSDQRGFSKDIYGTFLKTDGTISHTNGLGLVTIFNNQNYPVVTWGGTQFYLAWEEDQATGKTKIYGSRLSGSGALLDAGGIPISNTADLYCLDPDVAFDGTNFIVTYAKGIYEDVNDFDIIGNRVGADGVVLDPDGLLIAGGADIQKAPSLLFDGENYLLAWQDHNTGDDQVMAIFINPNGTGSPVGGFDVSKGYNSQLYSCAAFDSTNYMAVWCDSRNGLSMNIYAARINDQGVVLDEQAIPVTTGTSDCNDPVIAFNGTNYLVAWEKGNDIFGARISKAGVVMDPGGFVIFQDSYSQFKPAIASDGQNWLVVWEDGRNSSLEIQSDIYGAVVSPDGSVLQPQSIAISTAVFDQVNPAVAYAGGNYIAVWQDYRAGIAQTPNIFGTRIAADGTVLDIAGAGIIIDAGTPATDPALAFDGTNLLLCWTNGFYPEFTIKGARINTSFGLLDAQPLALSTGTSNQHNPCLAYNGENYTVLWMDYSDGLTYRIDMAKVATDGTIAETGVFSELDGHLSYPFIVKGPLKQVFGMFTAFMKNIGDTPVYGNRLLGMLIGQGQGPGIKEHQAEDIVKAARLWPNPATTTFTIGFELISPAFVNITISDATGKKVRDISGNEMARGSYSIETSVTGLTSGAYFISLNTGKQSVSLKLIVK